MKQDNPQKIANNKVRKVGDFMPNGAEIIRDSINEFSRVQNWMLIVEDKNSTLYQSMYDRYTELKMTLTSLGVNLAKFDKIEG